MTRWQLSPVIVAISRLRFGLPIGGAGLLFSERPVSLPSSGLHLFDTVLENRTFGVAYELQRKKVLRLLSDRRERPIFTSPSRGSNSQPGSAAARSNSPCTCRKARQWRAFAIRCPVSVLPNSLNARSIRGKSPDTTANIPVFRRPTAESPRGTSRDGGREIEIPRFIKPQLATLKSKASVGPHGSTKSSMTTNLRNGHIESS